LVQGVGHQKVAAGVESTADGPPSCALPCPPVTCEARPSCPRPAEMTPAAVTFLAQLLPNVGLRACPRIFQLI